MISTHAVSFDLPVALSRTESVAFVRDVEHSLAYADFLSDLHVGPGGVVRAELPVNASLFGQRRLRFESRLEPTVHGARLVGLPLDERPGWARVSGEAEVMPHPDGSLLRYRFEIEIHLAVPEPERWGGRALVKMIRLTAEQVLARVSARFPGAVQRAARAREATFV
ncbi:MAG: DUF3809 family protein [Trueperaceae bacterium]|nr:DUF3809 family protein [Trueperaceae bacterium]